MLTTLRGPTSKSDDEDARRMRERYKKKPLGTGKHKHHEGARKRWKEEISEKERRRYEAVWASNRGLFLTGGSGPGASAATGAEEKALSDCVANVVVRDLWSRSRLPLDELTEVWDLVDGSGMGRLNKAEFVVGFWLIDQRLRGRKIPTRVSDSVWGSAKGVNVTGPEKKHKKK